MKEVIVDADDLVCLGKDKLQEVIRCKDCVKYRVYGDGYCPWIEQTVEEEFFCADGKRKEE